VADDRGWYVDKFVALDVETANSRMSSICQVGIAVFEDGRQIFGEGTLLDPQEEFIPINVGIHGITAKRCKGAPHFSQFSSTILRLLNGQTVACHSTFDMDALSEACAKYSEVELSCRWIDTCEISKAVWPEFAERGGFSLGNLGEQLGIVFKHHDALEDARAAGLVLLRAMAHTGLDIDSLSKLRVDPDLLRVASGTRTPRKKLFAQKHETRVTGPSGPLTGEIVVFTGDFVMSRAEAADLAQASGATVEAGVTKRTTILVVGEQDASLLAPGQSKSAKNLKAEKLISHGQPIELVSEQEFSEICSQRRP
jgi:DNA polymerase-3 subunit epsilon